MESPVDSLTALEGKAREVLRLSVADKDTVKAAEFLQVFLNSLPPDGIEAFSQDIIRNQAPNDLCQFHDSLLSGLCVLLKDKRKSPIPSSSPTPESEEDVASLARLLETSSLGKRETAIRRVCLKRDGFRCVASGIYDIKRFKEHYPERQGQADIVTDFLNVAHILPFSLSTNHPSVVEHHARVLLTNLHPYFPSARDVIGHELINMSTNAPTLVSNVYPAFNAFKLAFEPTTGDNRYRCVSYVDSRWQYNYIHGRTIHMRDHGTRVPLPSRALLQFHAAIARVLHLTGAGELIDRVQRDRDEIRVLAQDGSTDVVRMVQMLTGH